MSSNGNSMDTNALAEGHKRVSRLLSSLDAANDADIDALSELEGNIDGMMNDTRNMSSGLGAEMRQILLEFDSGTLTDVGLEKFLRTEMNRRDFSVNTSKKLTNFMEEIYMAFSTIAERVNNGKLPTTKQVENFYRHISNVMGSVQGVQRILETPTLMIDRSIIEVEADMEERMREHKQVLELDELERKMSKQKGGREPIPVDDEDHEEDDSKPLFYKKKVFATSGTQTEKAESAHESQAAPSVQAVPAINRISQRRPSRRPSVMLSSAQQQMSGLNIGMGASQISGTRQVGGRRMSRIPNMPGVAESPDGGVGGGRVPRASIHGGLPGLKPRASSNDVSTVDHEAFESRLKAIERRENEVSSKEDELEGLEGELESKEKALKEWENRLTIRTTSMDDEVNALLLKRLENDSDRGSSAGGSRPGSTKRPRSKKKKRASSAEKTKEASAKEGTESPVPNDGRPPRASPSVSRRPKPEPEPPAPTDAMGNPLGADGVALEYDEEGNAIVADPRTIIMEGELITVPTPRQYGPDKGGPLVRELVEIPNNFVLSDSRPITGATDGATPHLGSPVQSRQKRDGARAQDDLLIGADLEQASEESVPGNNVRKRIESEMQQKPETSGGTIEMITEMWSDLLSAPEPPADSKPVPTIAMYPILTTTVGTSMTPRVEEESLVTTGTSVSVPPTVTVKQKTKKPKTSRPPWKKKPKIFKHDPKGQAIVAEAVARITPAPGSPGAATHEERVASEARLFARHDALQREHLALGGLAVADTHHRLINFDRVEYDTSHVSGLLQMYIDGIRAAEEAESNDNKADEEGGSNVPWGDLLEAETPLVALLALVGQHLPPVSRTLLLAAAEQEGYATVESAVREARRRGSSMQVPEYTTDLRLAVAENLCGGMTPSLRGIDQQACALMPDLTEATDAANKMLSLVEQGGVSMENKHLHVVLGEIFITVGSVAAARVWLGSQVLEFRAVFESMRRQAVGAIDRALRRNKIYNEAYQAFLSAQGRVIDLGNRVDALRELMSIVQDQLQRVTNHGVLGPETAAVTMLGGSTDTLHTATGVGGGDLKGGITSVQMTRMGSTEAGLALRGAHSTMEFDPEGINQLETDLATAREEIMELQEALAEMEVAGDRTPATLMFFAALYDPTYVDALEVIIEHLHILKPVANCKEHLNFETLRRYLLVAISHVSPLERFLKRYGKMHARWSQSRAEIFASRGQQGGDGDTSYTCPLCSTDHRDMRKEKGGEGDIPDRSRLADSRPDMTKINTRKKKYLEQPPPLRPNEPHAVSLTLPELKETKKREIRMTVQRRNW